MPWGRSPDGIMRDNGWKKDPEKRFRQRFHDGNRFTPYVRVGDATIWDLAFARHTPHEHEFDQAGEMMLWDSCSWIRFYRSSIETACTSNGMTIMSARIALDALTRFELCQLESPDALILNVAGRDFPRYPGDRIDQGRPGVLHMSMMFGREHESALRDLRELLERLCDRSLAEPGEKSVVRSPGPDEEHGKLRAAPSEERVDYWEPETQPELPAPAMPESGHAAPISGVTTKRRPAGSARPASRVLAVSVESAPDADGWLSFAAPSIQVLVTAGDAGHERPSGPADDSSPHPAAGCGDSSG